MTTKDMEKLINDRTNELLNIAKLEFIENKKEPREQDIKLQNFIISKVVELFSANGMSDRIDDYHLKLLILDKKFTTLNDEFLKKTSDIKKEAELLKKKLIITGIKNDSVKEILMKYLGM
ncbi:MAG: hypothetical protein ACRC6E_10315 [Fusobacteriaceae bacterium]